MNKWLVQIVFLVVKQVSPHLRTAICGMLAQLKQEAEKTDNPWDNVLVGLGQSLLDCPEK